MFLKILHCGILEKIKELSNLDISLLICFDHCHLNVILSGKKCQTPTPATLTPTARPQVKATSKHYYANGQHIATRIIDASSDNLYYTLSDHLGSTTLVLDANGDALGHVSYDAYGGLIQTDSTLDTDLIDRLFTGQRREASTGLYDYRGRFYDPAVGSFTQADSLVPGVYNPAAWNRYGYVYGNPTNYVDPSGHNPLLAWITGGINGILSVGSKICSMPGGCVAGIFDPNYTVGQRTADFTISFASGVAGFRIGLIGGATASNLVRAGRVAGFGVLSMGEQMALSYVRDDPFTTNDMAWAFTSGILFGGFGEVGSGRVRRFVNKRGWGIADAEHTKALNSLMHQGDDRWSQNNLIYTTLKKMDKYGWTPSLRSQLKGALDYPIRPIYQQNPLNLSPLGTTLIWSSRQFLSKTSRFTNELRDNFEDRSPNPRILY